MQAASGAGRGPSRILRDGPRPGGFEVASPGDSASTVQSKVEDWLQAGIRLVWVVYPDTRSVSVYRSLQEAEVLSEPDTLDGASVFQDFSASVRDLFA
jgi:Uma2 family endonuclease